MNNKKMATIFVILAACMWGTLGVTVRILSGFGFSSIQMVVARLSVSAVLLGIYLFITDKNKLKIKAKDIKWFIGTGIISMLFFNTCYCITVSLTSLSIAAVLLYTSPVFVMLLSFLIFKEKLTVKKGVAIILSVTGCVLVTGVLTTDAEVISVKGLTFGIFAAAGYAFYSIFAKILVRKYHPLTILVYTFLLAGFGGVFVGDIKGIAAIITREPVAILAVITVAMICSVIPYILYTNALKYIEASKVSIIASIEPVVATILGVVLFKEIVSFTGIIGIVCVLFAIILLNSES